MPSLPWICLHLWLPAACRPAELRLWPRVQVRRRVRLRPGLTWLACAAPTSSLLRRPPDPLFLANQEQPMKYLIRMLTRWTGRESRPSADERYLAQSVDAQDFEVRLQALARRAP